MKLEICSFSGQKIYPGKGKTYVRIDNKTFRFMNGKCEASFLAKRNPREINWTSIYRRLRKKGASEEVAKKKARKVTKTLKPIVGTTWETIRAKRTQKVEVRAAAREQAIREAKEKKKAEQTKKKSEKTKTDAPKFKPVKNIKAAKVTATSR